MRKLLPVLLLLVIAAGCNKEKIYTDNLQGEWDLYKYLLYNVDRTSLFDAQNPGYKIVFEGSNFIERRDSLGSDSIVGSFSFADNDEKIVLLYKTYTYTPVLDSANNVIDSIEVAKDAKREYTIFNLTKDHVQLRNDSSQLYMRKLVE